MKVFKIAGLLAALSFLVSPTHPAYSEGPTAGDGGERCLVRGARRMAECYRFDLPLNYDDPMGETIEVHVAVLKARGTGLKSDPLVVFAGGPGQAAGEYGAVAEIAFRDVKRKRDIILMDARGTGRSTPMQCDFPDDDTQFDEETVVTALTECRAGFDFDVRHVNLESIVQDMDRVRAYFGYEKLNLWGGSYGTRVVAHYLRRFPEHVRSLIVDGVVPPDIKLFETTGRSAERAKVKLVEDCNRRPACQQRYPDLDEKISGLIDAALEGSLIYDGVDPFTGAPMVFPFTHSLLTESLRSVMYASDATVSLPLAIEAASNGDLEPLLAGFLGGNTGMYLGMSLSVLCGEELARVTPEEARVAAGDSFARDSYYKIWSNYCSTWDYFTTVNGLPADLNAPIASDVPALILSGDLDPITPPEMGEHWHQTFPNSRHIIVQGTGHITSLTGCMPQLIGQFVSDLDAAALDTACLDHLERLPLVTGINGQVQ